MKNLLPTQVLTAASARKSKPVLANFKHERFADHIAAGMTQAEAYKSVGYRVKHVDSAASKLATKAKLRTRITELVPDLRIRVCEKPLVRFAIKKGRSVGFERPPNVERLCRAVPRLRTDAAVSRVNGQSGTRTEKRTSYSQDDFQSCHKQNAIHSRNAVSV